MADDEIIQTVKLELDPGNTVQEAANTGKKAGEAFTGGFKPNLSIRPDAAEKSAKDAAKVFSDVFSGKAITGSVASALTSAFSNVDLSKTVFGKNLDDAFSRVLESRRTQAAERREPREAPIPDITKHIQPFLSGVETLSLLLRGAPISSIVQMAGQTFRDFGDLRKERERARDISSAVAGAGGGGPRLPIPPGGIGAAESGAAGAAGFSLARMLGIGGAAVGGIAAVGIGGYELAKSVKEFGERGAETTLRWDRLRQTLGLTREEYARLAVDFARGGVSIDDSGRTLARMALTAKREMPEIRREVADYGNVATEASIKVTKARLEQEAATEHVRAAEGELVKVELTGADTRAQQAQAARLGVAGARLEARRAAAQAQVAPEEAAIADIRGPLSVTGARLGLRGAQLSAEEARAKLAEVASGQREDPEVAKARQLQRAQLQVETAELNEKQARLRIREAKASEEQRLAGPGPEEAAAQAQEQADLHVRQMETAEEKLRVEQTYVTQKDKENEAQRGVTAAQLGKSEADIAFDRAQKDQERLKYRAVVPVQEQLGRLARGEPLAEGYQLGDVESPVIRKAIESMGGGRGGPMFDITHQIIQGMMQQGAPFDEQLRVVQSIARGRGGGIEEARKNLDVFRKPIGQYTHEEMERQKEIVAAIAPEPVARAEDIEEKKGLGRLKEDTAALAAQQKVTPQIYGAAQTVVEGVNTGLSTLQGKAVEAAGALGGFAAKLMNFILPTASAAPKEGGTSTADEMTVPGGAAGGLTGLLSGPGTGTSDSIPINASAGEYIIKASSVRELGVPFLDALNAGGMQSGGSVDEERKRREKERKEYLKRTGYQAPKPYRPMLEGHGEEAKALAVAVGKPMYAPGRAPFGGYANAEQQRQAILALRGIDVGKVIRPQTDQPIGDIGLTLASRTPAMPATAVTKENLFFGKTPEEQAALRTLGTGLRFPPGTPLPRPRPGGEPAAVKPREPAAAAAAAADLRSFYDRPIGESASKFVSSAAGGFGQAIRDIAGGIVNVASGAGQALGDITGDATKGVKRISESTPREMFGGIAEGAKQGAADLARNIEKVRSVAGSENPYVIPKIKPASAPSDDDAGNYQSGGIVGAGAVVSEEDLRKIGMTKHKYSTAVDNPAVKAYAKSWLDSFANIGRLVTGKSEDVPADILKAGTDFLGSGFGVKKAFEEVVKATSGEALRFAPHILEKMVPEKENKPDVRDLGVKPEMIMTKLPDEEESHAAGGRIGMQGGGYLSTLDLSQGAMAAVARGASGSSASLDPTLMAKIQRRIGIVNPDLTPGAEMSSAQKFVRGFAMGGLLGDLADSIVSMPGYAEGGAVTGKTGGGATLSFHQLDLRTSAGTFSAGVSDDTMDSIRYSSLGSKLTQTGTRPSWYS